MEGNRCLLRRKAQKRNRRRKASPELGASGQPPEKASDSVITFDVPFIKQSVRSNYCGVYSTGMLLSRMGFTVSHVQALALFDLKRTNPNYSGASHQEIGNAFESITGIRWHWKVFDCFDFIAISRLLSKHQLNNRLPTLLSFGATHKNEEWKCVHAAVVLAVSRRIIELLDPLGKKPLPDAGANVSLRFNAPDVVEVIGNSYTIDHRGEVRVFCWS